MTRLFEIQQNIKECLKLNNTLHIIT